MYSITPACLLADLPVALSTDQEDAKVCIPLQVTVAKPIVYWRAPSRYSWADCSCKLWAHVQRWGMQQM